MVYTNMSKKELLQYIEVLELKLKDQEQEITDAMERSVNALVDLIKKEVK